MTATGGGSVWVLESRSQRSRSDEGGAQDGVDLCSWSNNHLGSRLYFPPPDPSPLPSSSAFSPLRPPLLPPTPATPFSIRASHVRHRSVLVRTSVGALKLRRDAQLVTRRLGEGWRAGSGPDLLQVRPDWIPCFVSCGRRCTMSKRGKCVSWDRFLL